MARNQEDELGELGLQILSAPEVEFCLSRDESPSEPLFGDAYGVNNCPKGVKTYMFDLIDNLSLAKVNVEAWHLESWAGQLEVTLDPVLGIAAIDAWHLCRQAIKQTAAQHHMLATLMSKPFLYEKGGNGGHFNHSLWRSERNEFWDSKAENNLSEAACHWLAGLIKHAPAMTAICNPTVNCYGRLHRHTVKTADWGVDRRFTLFRVKNLSEECTYIESRLPSSAANPYLVYAVHIAAGMDGLKNKLPLPKQKDPDAIKLPSKLSKALFALEEDRVIADAFNDLFMEWFFKVKRDAEIKNLEPSPEVLFSENKSSALKLERESYLHI